MSWSLRKKNPELPLAVFDIGGGSVSALLLTGDSERRIFWHSSLPLSFGRHENFQAFTSETFGLLDTLADRLRTIEPGPVGAVHCLLSSPWHIAEARRTDIIDIEPSGLVESSLARLSDQALARHISRHSSDGFVPVPLDNVIMLAELDGKSVQNLRRQPGKNLIVHHFLSSTDQKIKRRLSERLQSKFYHQTPQFHSNLLSTWSVIREAWPETEDFIILDVSGELTDLSVVRCGVIFDIASFPIGKYTIARRLAAKSGESPLTTYAALKLRAENLLHEAEREHFDLLLHEPKNEWLYSLVEFLAAVEHPGKKLPLVVVGDDAASLLIGEWVATDGRPAPTVADYEFLADLYPDKRPETKNTPVLLAGLFARNYL